MKNTIAAITIILFADNAFASAYDDFVSKPLDLNLSIDGRKMSTENKDFSAKKILPDLFNQKKKEKNTVIRGKLLNNPSNPDYIDSVEGAVVSIEIKHISFTSD